MACRIRNLGNHPLRIDLLGGETLHLPPGGVSPPMREEWLSANWYLWEWTQRGLARIEPARMSEVLEAEARPLKAQPKKPAPRAPAGAGQKAGAESPGPSAGSSKKPAGPKSR